MASDDVFDVIVIGAGPVGETTGRRAVQGWRGRMTTTDRTAGLRAARTTIHTLETAGTPITATAVAQAAGVSTWLPDTDGVREHLDAARHRQAQASSRPSGTDTATEQAPLTPASLRTDLALARAEIRQLRTEHDKLRHRLRLQLGAVIDAPNPTELITRVAELEDDPTAARESLRRVVKDHNKS